MSWAPSHDGAGRVFHLTTPQEWADACEVGRIEPRSLATEGFVHCSTVEQLTGTIERHFGTADELVVVELDPTLAGELRWEESRPGERYPHLYRPLVATDVTGIHHWRRSPDGRVEIPRLLGVPEDP